MATPPYTDKATLERRFTKERVAQFFQVQAVDGSSTGVADPDTLDAAIVDASSDFDEIVGVNLPMPLVQNAGNWDPAIVEIVSVFTMFRGASLRPEYADAKVKPYESDYKMALQRAREIQQGKRRLIHNQPGASNAGGEVTVNNPSPDAAPHYFWPNPQDGRGGMSGF